MFPVLIDIPGFPIHTYGILLALGFGAALVTLIAVGRVAGFRSEDLGDLALVALVSGLVGGRLLYVIVEWDQFADNLMQIVLRRDGFVFYGGLLLAAPVTILFLRRRGLPLAPLADVIAPALALGHSIGRLGCFAQGCCYGRASVWGLTFHDDSAASVANGGFPVIPVQLYESLLLLGLFGLLLFLRGRFKWPGALMCVYLAVYAVIRFGLESLRADDRGFYLGPLSVSQLISIGLLAFSAILAWRLRTRQPIP